MARVGRRVQVFELRLDFAYNRKHSKWRPFRKIAETMGLCSSVVHRHWQRTLRDVHDLLRTTEKAPPGDTKKADNPPPAQAGR
jgi:hypothetical protein